METTATKPSKTKKVFYWITTIWLAFGMLSSGLVQLMRTKEELDLMASLQYPVYLLTIIGSWKMLGVIAVLVPKFPLLKEWAYAGFFFLSSGALVSHLFTHHTIIEMIGPILLLVLTVASWCLRPANRRIVSSNQ
jgi:hypothetical protein